MALQEDLEKQLKTTPQPLDLSKVSAAGGDASSSPVTVVVAESGFKSFLHRFIIKPCQGHCKYLPYLGLAALLSFVMIFFGIDSLFFKGQFIIDPNAYVRSATLSLGSENTSFAVGDEFDVTVSLETGEAEVAGVDLYMTYDTTALEVVDSVATKDGIQILPSELFQNVYTNTVDTVNGKITMIVGMPRGETVKTTKPELLATISFKALKNTATTKVSIDYSADKITSTDSNVTKYLGRDVADVLGETSDLSLTLGDASTDTEVTGEKLKVKITKPEKAQTIKPGDTVSFAGTVTGGKTPYEYLWDFDSKDIDEQETLNPTAVDFEEAGTYKVKFTVIDALGEEDSDTVKITVNELSSDSEIDTPPQTTIPSNTTLDSDRDGILDSEENVLGQDDYITNPQVADTDSDQFNDAIEIRNFYVPVHDSRKNLFSDISPAQPFYKYIEILRYYQATNGYADGSFKPKNTITRAEALKMIVDGLKISKQTCTTLPFTDLPTGHWINDYVCTAYQTGIATGSGNSFKPWVNITRAEFVKMLVKAKGLTLSTTATQFTDAKGTEFDTYIATAHAAQLVSGYNPSYFGAWRNINREEAAKIIARTIRLGKNNG